MKIEQMIESFAKKQEIGYNVYGALAEDDRKVHFELRFTGAGVVSQATIDGKSFPEFGTEAWNIIEADGNDDAIETYLSGILVGLLASPSLVEALV